MGRGGEGEVVANWGGGSKAGGAAIKRPDSGQLNSWTVDACKTTGKPYTLDDGAFQWNNAKAAQNYAKHGVTFEAAPAIFDDPFAIEEIDGRENYGEERFITIGMASGRLLAVLYTQRGETVRIITARGAEPYEQPEYHERNK